MARPNQEAIDTFMSIAGVSEATAIQKLEEHGGNLNEAVNAHFNAEDTNRTHQAPVDDPVDDDMDIDDTFPTESRRPLFPPSSSARLTPFSLLDPDFASSLFDRGTGFTRREPFVSHPREVRQIPIEVKDETEPSGRSGRVPIIEDVTDSVHAQAPEIHGNVIIDDDDDDDSNSVSTAQIMHAPVVHSTPSAPAIDDFPNYNNDIEEEMLRAAIEASKRDAVPQTDHGDSVSRQWHSLDEDRELERAMSLSLKAAEQEKTFHQLEGGESQFESNKLGVEEEPRNMIRPNGRQSRLEVGSSSVQDEVEDVEELPLVRQRRRRMSSPSADPAEDTEEIVVSPPASPGPNDRRTQQNGRDFHFSEWGGISSTEHDEAVMLEAAMFGGIPEGSGYHFPSGTHQFMQNGADRTTDPYFQRIPRTPSPSLTAQREIREQQDDAYLASLQADREKELKAKEDAEAAFAEERRKEEESRRKMEEEQEIERQLAAKEASLPQEPELNDENAINLLVRLPDGSRRGRRFLKSDQLQNLFDFLDVGRVVKPGTYRLVRPYPRRAFSDGESALTFNELGISSKQEALFLELI